MPLNQYVKKTLLNTFGFINLNALIRHSDDKLISPFYHTISDTTIPHIASLYPIRNSKTFEKDLDFFTKHYTPINIDQLYDHIKSNNSLQQPSFYLSFDDGLKEMISVVAPILYKKGIPATFFINSGFIDNKDLFYRYKVSLIIERIKKRPPSTILNKEINHLLDQKGIENDTSIIKKLLRIDYLNKDVLEPIAILLEVDFKEYLHRQQPYLSTSDIKELLKMGFTIGGHSIDHPHYKTIELKEQLRQTEESVSFLKTEFNLPYSYFSFPFSDENVSLDFFQTIFNQEKPKIELSFGISGLKKDISPFHIHRIPMEENQLSAEQLVKSEYLYYIAKSFLNKNKVQRI